LGALFEGCYKVNLEEIEQAAKTRSGLTYICKYAAVGKIPAVRIGRVWRFYKETIDKWISSGGEINILFFTDISLFAVSE